MSRSDPDLHNAISLRPSPFHHHPDRSTSHGSESPSRHHHHHHHHQHHSFRHDRHEPSPRPDRERKPPASTTAVEVAEGDETGGDPVPRPTYHRSSSEHERDDVERQGSLPGYDAARDPYRLRDGLKDLDQEKERVKANSKQKRRSAGAGVAVCAPVVGGLTGVGKSRKIIQFYQDQNDKIERLLTSVDDHVAQAKEEQGADAMQFKIAVNGSFVANVILAILQVYGAVSSGSLSLFTTMADAIFDPCSNLTLILCNRAVNRVDPRRFPSGKGRLETAGNIAFCFLMTAVSMILIVESIRELATPGDHDTKFHVPSVIAVGIAFVTKFCLFLYCWALRNKYSQIHILWEDHRNDLFINGFGLMTSVLGSKIAWWIDPAGAIVLSLLISFLWTRTAYQEFQLLIGVTADTAFLQHVTYISMTHDARVLSLDTVRAWHSGPRLIVEVDIVMDQEMSLRETHDVAEELQMKLESLPDVERAYVHVDYETTHSPEHFLKKEL